jgi:hypothetical protein
VFFLKNEKISQHIIGEVEGILLHDVWALNILQWLQQEAYVEWFQLASVCHLLHEWIYSLKRALLTKSIPTNFSQFSALETLEIDKVTASLTPLDLSPLLNLRKLTLSSGYFPSISIEKLTKLEELSLSHTGPMNILPLNLKKLTLHATPVYKFNINQLVFLTSSNRGDFERNGYTGMGKYESRNVYVNESYEGEWKNGLFHGEGVFILKDWNLFTVYHYRGGFKEGLRDGSGVATCGEIVFEGYWYRGCEHGRGKASISGKVFSDGEWVMGEPPPGNGY